MYTVKQLSDLADISVRTLHYYDEIGLLRPSKVGSNSYRYYDDAAVLRLQQILFYREIGLELMQIKDILDDSKFDVVTALRSHRAVLQEKIHRLENLVGTVDSTIRHLAGEETMSKKKLFEGFNEEKQKEYEREARLQYGPDKVNESIKRWNSYSPTQRDQIMNESGQVYEDIVTAIDTGLAPDSDDVQKILVRWQENLRNFYEPTLDTLRGLGELYNTDPAFIANFQKLHPGLPEYLQAAITQYVDDLEYAEIERLLAEDEVQKAQR
ncbi:MAG TPA: MerR family transcriptional regulator [Phototrophicaceae bacterium]|jgi:DNA-binding transcriptional MerR regulator|nr:MerR family transcriptional regulator [Phototrophicaceae bacterium]